MKKSKLSSILDVIFGISFVFLVSYIWIRYFVHNTLFNVIICAVFTFAVCSLYYVCKKKKREQQSISTSELKKANNCSKLFLVSGNKETVKILEKMLKEKHTVKSYSSYLIVNNIGIAPCYNSTVLTEEQVLSSAIKLKNKNLSKIILLCVTASKEAISCAKLFKQLNLVIFTEQETYRNLLKPFEFEYQSEITEKPKRREKASQLLNIMFNKERTKGYFVSAIILLFASFFMRYNLYYLISSTVLCLLALYSHFNLKFNKQIKKEELF